MEHSQLQRITCHRGVLYKREICPTYVAILANCKAKSEHSLACCAQSLLRDIADRSRHALAIYTTVSPCVYTVGNHALAAHSNVAANTLLPSFYNKCACSSYPSWLSFISIISQAHPGAICLMLIWLPSCMKILLTVRMQSVANTLNYSIIKYTEQRTPDIYVCISHEP